MEDTALTGCYCGCALLGLIGLAAFLAFLWLG